MPIWDVCATNSLLIEIPAAVIKWNLLHLFTFRTTQVLLFRCFRDEEHQIAIRINSEGRKKLICRWRIAPILKRARFLFIFIQCCPRRCRSGYLSSLTAWIGRTFFSLVRHFNMMFISYCTLYSLHLSSGEPSYQRNN